jgi:FG-GAP-like repeat
MKAKLVARMLVGVALLSGMIPAWVWGNHRSGSIALPEAIVAGDFNEDGHVDVAVINTGFDQVAILLGDGHGTLTLKGLLPVDTLPKDIQVADINKDGHQDLMVSNTWGYNVLLFLGDGHGGFSRVDELDADEPLGMTVADFKDDGHLDLAVATKGKEVLVFSSRAKGRFIKPPLSIAAQSPFALATGDFNADGYLDIAVTDRGNDMVFALLGDGAGSFTKTASVPVSDRPARLATGDLDENGTLDLVVAGGLPENEDGIFLAILLGDGAGNFALTRKLTFGPGSLRGQVVLEDFNEDGHNDMVVSNRGEATVSVLLGDGAAGFARARTFSVLP